MRTGPTDEAWTWISAVARAVAEPARRFVVVTGGVAEGGEHGASERRFEIGNRIDGDGRPTVIGGDHQRLDDPADIAPHGHTGMREQAIVHPDTGGRVMIPRNGNDSRASGAEAYESLIEKGHGLRRRDRPVVEVTGYDD